MAIGVSADGAALVDAMFTLELLSNGRLMMTNKAVNGNVHAQSPSLQ